MPFFAPGLRAARWLDRAVLAALCAFLAWLFASPLRAPEGPLAYAQDDLYYYLVTARNVAAGLGSTFDGHTPTNGYHPLYFLLWCALGEKVSDLRAVFRALWLLDLASGAAIFCSVRAFCRRLTPSPWVSNAAGLCALYLCSYKIFGQMEVTLAMPLAFVFVERLERALSRPASLGGWLLCGALAGLLVLARLDAALLVALCGLGLLAGHPSGLRALSPRAWLAALLPAAAPVAIYLAVNLRFFGALLPVSGAAKQLKPALSFSWAALQLSWSTGSQAVFVLLLLGLAAVAVCWQRLPARLRALALAMLLFPFVHWGLNLMLSDWRLWPWYGYSLCVGAAACFLLAAWASSTPEATRAARILGPLAFAGVACALLLLRYRPDRIAGEIAEAARQVAAYRAEHPGRYAMGDRAGMVAYLSPQPMLQLEGLMMDRAFLERIRRGDDLRAVLAAYGVDHYVGFTEQPQPGCFSAREPRQGGADSPAMRGEFCEPVATFDGRGGRTMIFALARPQP